MLSPLDISRLQSLPIEQVAEALGLKVQHHKSLCPFHPDRNPSLQYRTSKNKYKCFVCNHYGGPIDLTQEVMRLNFPDAASWLAQTFGITLDDTHTRTFRDIHPREVKPVPKEVAIPLDTTVLAQMVAQPTLTPEARHFLFQQRRLDPRVIRWCGISSTHTDLLIPYFDLDGKFTTIQWRHLPLTPISHASPHDSLALPPVPQASPRGLPSPNHRSPGFSPGSLPPRFRFPKGTPPPIYNLQILRLLTPGEPLYITEGASDCWAMLSSGHKAIAIPSATLLNPQNLLPLQSHLTNLNTPLHMYPDQDPPGEHLFSQLSALLPITRHTLPPTCKDYSDYYLQSQV